MRPDTPIPQDLRDRLDAVRDHLDVDILWVERGDPRCCGRDFGYWVVTVAPYGWREQLAAWRAAPRGVGVASPEKADCPRWSQVEAADLSDAIERALDGAERLTWLSPPT